MKITASGSPFRSQLIAQVDATADAARLSVVGDAARITEYQRAQEQAQAFKDAGYAGTAPTSVASWAVAKGWTNQQACDDILAASVRWYAALDFIRATRLQTKEAIRMAPTKADADALYAQFAAQLASAMQGVA